MDGKEEESDEKENEEKEVLRKLSQGFKWTWEKKGRTLCGQSDMVGIPAMFRLVFFIFPVSVIDNGLMGGQSFFCCGIFR